MLSQFKAKLHGMLAQRVATAQLTQHHAALRNAQLLRLHHLVGGAVLKHAVLMDTALVNKGVRAHNRLVGRHLDAGQPPPQDGSRGTIRAC